eukprot:IDg9911t1
MHTASSNATQIFAAPSKRLTKIRRAASSDSMCTESATIPAPAYCTFNADCRINRIMHRSRVTR